MILSSAHVHTTFCDGIDSPEEMVVAAIKKGFVSLGFTSHGAQNFDLRYCMNKRDENKYIAEIHALQKKYRDEIRIWVGIERDTYSISKMGKYQYTIASQHYLLQENGWLPVNAEPADAEYFILKYFSGDGMRMAEQYFTVFSDYIARIRPSIIGHFDIIRTINDKRVFFDELSSEYKTAALNGLKRARTNCNLLELNTGNYAKKKERLFPASFLLEAWNELGGKIIINSDCHNCEFIDAGYAPALIAAQKAGFKSVERIGTGTALFETVYL